MAGPTLSGASASTWQSRLSGVMDPFPALTNMIPAFKLSALPVTPYDAAVYKAAFGMPSFLAVTPGYEPLGRSQVLVRTPSREYTVGQQELLRDMGNEQSVSAHTHCCAVACCACACAAASRGCCLCPTCPQHPNPAASKAPAHTQASKSVVWESTWDCRERPSEKSECVLLPCVFVAAGSV